MDAYIYRADIYCERCGEKIRAELETDWLKDSGEETRRMMSEAEDGDIYPQGPYNHGGGEADCPQHCGSCGVFLENPLTSDGFNYVWDALADYARGEGGNADVLRQWAERYGMEFNEPLSVTLDDLKSTYSLDDDDLSSATSVWFDIAAELFTRGEDIPTEWRYYPGAAGSPINRDSMYALECAGAPPAVLFEFAAIVMWDIERLKAAEEAEDIDDRPNHTPAPPPARQAH